MSYYGIVRGPLGVGKTEVSRRVAAAISGTYVSIDAILEAHDLEEWEAGFLSEGCFLRANAVAAEEVRSAIGRGAPAVIDGNFYWRSAVEDLVGRLPYPHAILTLSAPLEVCVARDARREPPHGAEAAREVYARTSAVRFGRVIDAARPIDTVVGAVLRTLRQASGETPPSRGRPGDRFSASRRP